MDVHTSVANIAIWKDGAFSVRNHKFIVKLLLLVILFYLIFRDVFDDERKIDCTFNVPVQIDTLSV